MSTELHHLTKLGTCTHILLLQYHYCLTQCNYETFKQIDTFARKVQINSDTYTTTCF